MKKRTMAFGGLLMAVAVTTYSVSGTYAKYISDYSASDTARVAQWGFNAPEDVTMFGYAYKENGEVVSSPSDNVVVKSSTGVPYDLDNVVAPGTQGSYKATIIGTSETNFVLTAKVEDIQNTFKIIMDEDDYTALKDDDEYGKYVLTEGPYRYYRPIVFSVSDGTPGPRNWVSGDQLETEINNALGDLANTVQAAGTDINKTIEISWKWNFNDTENVPPYINEELANIASKYDTKLGQKVAEAITAGTSVDDCKITLKAGVVVSQSNKAAGTRIAP